MASRSDQLHSHQFTLQRVVGALAMRDPDPAFSPMRRIGGALFAGVMLAALALAAVGVYGVINPGGNDSWRDGTSVIVERETGARFIFDPAEGVLHPVLNQASALLLLGSAEPKTARVSAGSLRGVPRGAARGIPGAPDPLPDKQALVTGAWTLCSRTPDGGWPESVLLIGGSPAAGGLTAVGDADGLLVADPSGKAYLIWQNRRLAVRDDLVLAALWGGEKPVPVAAALLNAVTPGPDLKRIALDTGGRSGVDNAANGQVFVHEGEGSGKKYAVALPGGLADITQVQADLLLADAAYPNPGGRPSAMTPATYAAAHKVDGPEVSASPPTSPTLLRPPSAGGVCVSFVDGGAAPVVAVAGTVARTLGESRTGGVWQGSVVADNVWVVPGRGALVEAIPAPGLAAGPLALVTDQGVRYPVPSSAVAGMLGYSGVRPQRLPASLVALVPAGRALDPAAARAAVSLVD